MSLNEARARIKTRNRTKNGRSYLESRRRFPAHGTASVDLFTWVRGGAILTMAVRVQELQTVARGPSTHLDTRCRNE
jgi:hypothetical protein